ncbi:MAG: winged helix-turn-helix domain-containing protein [Chloroflexi bacterium]|nr:winged helix-turn-helix domain-containing protein [Chloroflexota bacterium]
MSIEAFVPIQGFAVKANEFIMRSKPVADISALLSKQDPGSFNLVGEPGTGKTSLLHYAYRVKLGSRKTQKGLYVWIGASEILDYDAAGIWRHGLECLKKEEAAEGINRPLDIQTREARDLFQAFQAEVDWLLVKGGYARITLLVDDFDLIVPVMGVDSLRWLRSFVTLSDGRVVLGVASTDPIQDVVNKHYLPPSLPSPPFNYVTSVQLGLLETHEAVNLINKLAETMGGMPPDKGELRALLDEAGRHIELLKIACEYYFALKAKRRASKKGDRVSEGVLWSDFRFDSQVRSRCRQLILRRLTEERLALTSIDEADPHVDPSLLKQLERKGLVEERANHWKLFGEVLSYWLPRWADLGGPELPRTIIKADFEYLPDQRQVRVVDRLIQLTALEDRLLRYLASHSNRLCSKTELLANVWGRNRSITVVEKTVNRLRARIEADPARPQLLISHYGGGYLLRTS